jgi:hypothetical protein
MFCYFCRVMLLRTVCMMQMYAASKNSEARETSSLGAILKQI